MREMLAHWDGTDSIFFVNQYREHFLYLPLGKYEARFVTEVDHEGLNIGL
jgi:hypothetical protein